MMTKLMPCSLIGQVLDKMVSGRIVPLEEQQAKIVLQPTLKRVR